MSDNHLQNLKRADLVISLLLAIIVAITRIPLVSKFLYEWDSASYALAFENYSIAHQQPHPPGYILYVALGKGVNYLFNDANTSMVFLSIIFGILTALLVYFLAKEIFSRKVAIISSLLLIFNPLFWFYGEIASIYIFEAFFAALIAYLSYKAFKGNSPFIYLSALALGLAGGFRLDLVEFMFPLWLFCLWYGKTSYAKAGKAFIVLIASVLLWLVPTILSTGGLGQYMQLSAVQSEASVYTSILLGASLSQQIMNSGIALIWSLWGLTLFGIFMVILFLLYHWRGWKSKFIPYLKNPVSIFFLLWIAPAFLFYFIIYIIKPGYTLVYLPAVMIILGYIISRISDDLSLTFPKISPRSFLAALLLVGIIINSLIFIYPYNLHQGELWETPQDKLTGSQKILFGVNVGIMYNDQKISANDQNTQLHIDEITKLSFSNPNSSIVVIRDISREDEGFNWRKAMYYLPDYNVYYLFDFENSGITDKVSVWHGKNHTDDLIKATTVEIPLNQSVRRIIWIMSDQSSFYKEVQSKAEIQTITLPNGLKIYYSDVGDGPVNLQVSGFIFKR